MQIFLAFSVQKNLRRGGGSFGADFQRIRERTFKIRNYEDNLRFLLAMTGGVYKYKKITTPNDVVII